MPGNLSKAFAVLRNPVSTFEGIKDEEFLSAVRELTEDPAVRSMGNFNHHDATTLRHVISVSLVSYYLARACGLDSSSTARGALLHDFFLYDWRDGIRRQHRTTHPRTALYNALNRFSLNDVEADIIFSHMWPVARPIPKYRESFLVGIVDKIVSTREVFRMFRLR